MSKEQKIKKEVIDALKGEKYFICEKCAVLTTWSEILNDCSNGGNGMCYCEFTTPFWNKEINCIDVDTPRILNEYTEISRDLYDRLKNENNDILRLNAFNCIPRDKLITYEEPEVEGEFL